MNDHTTHAQYLEKFTEGDVRKEALKQALDIRKFEIELYWKRATYFWTFIAAAFAGYFALQSQKDPDLANVYVVSCLGFIFSLAWYGVNRGSGAWQRNWEAHVDLLEDKIIGPLYKTLINRQIYKLHHLAEPYSFSPSRINNLLALLVTGSWLILLARTLTKIGWPALSSGTVVSMTVFTVIGVIILLHKGYSRPTDDSISIHQRTRTFLQITHPPSARR